MKGISVTGERKKRKKIVVLLKQDKVGTKRPWVMKSLPWYQWSVWVTPRQDSCLLWESGLSILRAKVEGQVLVPVVSCSSHHPPPTNKCQTPPNYIHHVAFNFLSKALSCWVWQFTLQGAGEKCTRQEVDRSGSHTGLPVVITASYSRIALPTLLLPWLTLLSSILELLSVSGQSTTYFLKHEDELDRCLLLLQQLTESFTYLYYSY